MARYSSRHSGRRKSSGASREEAPYLVRGKEQQGDEVLLGDVPGPSPRAGGSMPPAGWCCATRTDISASGPALTQPDGLDGDAGVWCDADSAQRSAGRPFLVWPAPGCTVRSGALISDVAPFRCTVRPGASGRRGRCRAVRRAPRQALEGVAGTVRRRFPVPPGARRRSAHSGPLGAAGRGRALACCLCCCRRCSSRRAREARSTSSRTARRSRRRRWAMRSM